LRSSGTILIVDRSNQCLRELDQSGIIRTIAGTGKSGGDHLTVDSPREGRLATACDLRSIDGVSADSSDRVLFGETALGQIYRINPDGTLSTLLPTTLPNFQNMSGMSDGRILIPEDKPGQLKVLGTDRVLRVLVGWNNPTVSSELKPMIHA